MSESCRLLLLLLGVVSLLAVLQLSLLLCAQLFF